MLTQFNSIIFLKERKRKKSVKLVHSAINVLQREMMTVNGARALETPFTPSTHFYFPIHADLGIDVTCTLA